MKALGILAAASLALSPVAAGAGSDISSDTGATDSRPISGPLAGRVLTESEVPVTAIVVGGLVLLGGLVIGVLAGGSSDSNNNTNN